MKVKKIIDREIERCYHECPYFGLEGGPSPTMICNHPFWDDKGAYAGCIISHPACDDGFPPLCPLFKENGIEPPPVKKEKRNSDYLKEGEEKLSFHEQMSLIVERRLEEAFVRELGKELEKEVK